MRHSDHRNLNPKSKNVQVWSILQSMYSANPDGYEYSRNSGYRFWRKTRSDNGHPSCKGVDGNRNWGYEWGGNVFFIVSHWYTIFCKDFCNLQEVEVVETNAEILTVAPSHFLRSKYETLEIMYSNLIQFQFCPQVCTAVVNFIYGLMDMIITNIQTTMRRL